MRCSLLILFSFAISAGLYADSSVDLKREAALKGIAACLRRNEASSRECKSLNKNVEILVDIYRQGDKSVLPTLLRFTYLTKFYDETLVADPDSFLTAVSNLPNADQRSVAAGLAGSRFGLARRQFDAVRATLSDVPESSPNYQLAHDCLAILETTNASFLLNYFPPQTFVGRSGDFQVRWYSSEMYALDEKPLWSAVPAEVSTYRITVLPAFSAPESVELTVLADGTGRTRLRKTNSQHVHLDTDSYRTTSPQNLADFFGALNRSNFWKLPTESPQRGLDGAEWILEGVQDDNYHIVVRWCPGKTPFGQLGQELFEIAGDKLRGGC